MGAPGGALTERRTTGWVLTDGKAGDEEPCRAVVEALGLAPEIRRVAPRPLFAMLGLVDPRDGSLGAPFPDLAVASGRRAVPYLRRLKRLSGGRTFTVFLKDPRRAGIADLVWASEHDGLRGPSVVTTLTGPHRVSAERLARLRADPDPRLAALKRPRVAVLVGGDSRHHRFTRQDGERLVGLLGRLACESGAGLMITASRRTPADLAAALAGLAAETGGFCWDGSGTNPYAAMLALAETVVVTTDSTNMLGEAAATGRPVLTFAPLGGHPRFRHLLDGLRVRGITRDFTGMLEGGSYPPLDATPVIAEAVAAGLARHRAGLATA